MGYTQNLKIAYSGVQGQIEDQYWEAIKKNPLEYLEEDQIDDTKLRETYKSIVRSLGVRIY